MAQPVLTIVIMGAGEVGKGLARRLSAEGHHLTVVDINPALLADIENHYDVRTLEGNGAGLTVLRDAGIGGADMFIAVSASDEHNLLSCGAAKQFGVKTTIARVRGEDYIFPDRSYYQNAMGIDYLINPDEVAANELYDILENPVANSVTGFAEGRIKMVGMRVGMDAPIRNRTLLEFKQLGYSGAILVVSVVRGNEIVIPRGGTEILPGDQIYVIAESGLLDKVNAMGGVRDRSLRKVVMVGASRVSYFLSERLDHAKTRLILIEKDEARCNRFADELDGVTILNGDGTDVSELNESGVANADCFIASAQEDETNILSALLAKEQGARRVISLLRKPQYIPLMSHIQPIDVVINPRLATINSIMRYIRQGKALSMATIAEERAEAVEMVIPDESPLAGRMLKDIRIPADTLIGVIIRGGKVIIPKGDDTLERGDRVIAIGLRDKVEEFDELLSRTKDLSAFGRMMKSISGKPSRP